jgi:hypothetical protein
VKYKFAQIWEMFTPVQLISNFLHLTLFSSFKFIHLWYPSKCLGLKTHLISRVPRMLAVERYCKSREKLHLIECIILSSMQAIHYDTQYIFHKLYHNCNSESTLLYFSSQKHFPRDMWQYYRNKRPRRHTTVQVDIFTGITLHKNFNVVRTGKFFKK